MVSPVNLVVSIEMTRKPKDLDLHLIEVVVDFCVQCSMFNVQRSMFNVQCVKEC